MKKYWIFILLLTGLIISANKCDQGEIKNKTGIVKEYTHLDGCNFIIELDDGTKLEPMEVVPVFEFRDGQKVKISYTPLEGVASTCMVGKLVKITKIKKR